MIAAFPWEALPELARDSLDLASRAKALSGELERLAAVLSELAAEPVGITIRGASDRPASPAAFAVRFGDVVVDAEPPLAAALVARVLRQRAPVVPGTAPASALEVGSFAAILHTALRRVRAEPVRLAAAGAAPAVLSGLGGDLASLALGVEVGGAAFGARVTFPRTLLPETDFDLAALGQLPLALPLVVHSCVVGRHELELLRRGDALVLADFPLRTDGDALVGPVAVVAPASERGHSGDLAADGRLMLRTQSVTTHSWDAMSNDDSRETGTLHAIADAPVVVRIELGSVAMTAREWAALGPGDAIALGRKLGAPVVLRAGGLEVAQGELVQVDGEYGVRILEVSS